MTEPEQSSPKPKSKRNRGKGGPTTSILSIETYNAMYEAFCVRQTVAHVARVCKINAVTSKRYIEKGDPSRHLRPLRERWEQVQRNSQMAEDYSLVKARRDVQTAARAFLLRVAKRVQNLDPAELDANQLAKQLETTQRVIERTLGVADATVEVRGPDKWDGWTVDEMLAYAQTGEKPERALRNRPAIKAHEPDAGGK